MHILPFNKYAKGTYKMAFLGDLMCQNSALDSVVNSNPFKYLQPWLASHDYVVGNLETTFSGKNSDYPIFSSNDLFAEYLQKNLDAVFTANNHCYDMDVAGITRTIETLDDFGIQHIGTSKSGQIRQILDVKLQNHEISFINYTQFLNGKKKNSSIYEKPSLPEEASRQISLYTEASAQDTINTAKKKSELVIFGIHQATNQYRLKPSNEQEQLLTSISEMGADVVIGGHPHVFQGAKVSDDGKIIVYSLGNFFGTMKKITEYPVNSGCAMVLNCDGFGNLSYSFLPLVTIQDEKTLQWNVLPLAPLEIGAYSFLSAKQRNELLRELKKIRKTLSDCNLSEEVIPVHFLRL